MARDTVTEYEVSDPEPVERERVWCDECGDECTSEAQIHVRDVCVACDDGVGESFETTRAALRELAGRSETHTVKTSGGLSTLGPLWLLAPAAFVLAPVLAAPAMLGFEADVRGASTDIVALIALTTLAVQMVVWYALASFVGVV